MELFLIIATIVGLVAGLIAISDKSREFLFNKNRMKHVFESEFDDWKDSGKSYVSQRSTFLKIANFIRTNKFDKEREAFCVASGTHYGDHIFKDVIDRNIDNDQACIVLLNMLEKRGVRVGWRAEYVLSTMDQDILDACISSLPYEYANRDNIRASIDRIRTNQVIQYLERTANKADQKLRNYAKEVLRQVKE